MLILLNRHIPNGTYGDGVLCKVVTEMKEGPSERIEHANSPNNPNAAVVKSYGSERLGKTPQVGVISPIVANLFMHYAFDVWMTRNYKDVPFERYVCKCQPKSLPL